METVIFGNGEFKTFDIVKKFVDLNNVFTIGVDGGCNYLIENNIKIDLLIGDFDSIKYKNFIDKVLNIKKIDMDYSDLEIATNYCIDKKFSKVYLFGCTGKRSDHFLFNLRLMNKFFQNNIEVFMIDEFNVITLFDGERVFEKDNFEFFSLVPIYENTVVSIIGAEYDLNNKELDMISALTLSNKWKKEKVNIRVNKPVFIYLVF